MARRAEAYVDTSALIALADRSDSYHPLFRRLFSEPPRLVTTALVVAEGHGWFLKRFDTSRGLQFLARFQQPDGSWSLQSFDDGATLVTDTAATGLALLAFQGAGYTGAGGARPHRAAHGGGPPRTRSSMTRVNVRAAASFPGRQ